MQVIVLEDGLASNGPHLDLLERLNLRYLIGAARENDHAMLFQHLEGTSADWFADPSEEGRAVDRRLRVVEDVPLSSSRSDRRVTVLQVPGTHPDAGQETRTPMDLDLRICR